VGLTVRTTYSTGTQFTGKERDQESGLDWFESRYYSGAQGRFTSPDSGNLGVHLSDPQTWNMYAYVRNNPLKYVDPNGTDVRICIDVPRTASIYPMKSTSGFTSCSTVNKGSVFLAADSLAARSHAAERNAALHRISKSHLNRPEAPI